MSDGNKELNKKRKNSGMKTDGLFLYDREQGIGKAP
jgi:hypothetical protein